MSDQQEGDSHVPQEASRQVEGHGCINPCAWSAPDAGYVCPLSVHAEADHVASSLHAAAAYVSPANSRHLQRYTGTMSMTSNGLAWALTHVEIPTCGST